MLHEETNWIAVAALLLGVILIGSALSERGERVPADCGTDGSKGAVERLFVCPPTHQHETKPNSEKQP
jgi:hypothetical protein